MTVVLLVAGLILAVAAIVIASSWLVRRRRRPAEQVFEGTFTFGWEVSSFVPGPAANTAPRYWVAWTPDSGFMERFRESGYDPAWTPGYGAVRTRVVGLLENGARAGYGHMGQYEAQLTVLRVLEMGRVDQATSRG